MTWTSKYNATFTKLLIRQLVAFIQRDQRAALDFVGGTDVLPSFVTYQLSPQALPQFPAVLVAPMQLPFVPEAVGSLEYSVRLYCAVGVAHQDPEVLAELAQDYIHAIDAIFNTIDIPDFYSSLSLTLRSTGAINTTALAAGTVKDLFVVSHNYDQIRRAQSGFQCAATLELLIDREET